MEQGGTHLCPSGKLIPKEEYDTLVHGPSNTISIRCTRQDPLGPVADDYPGLMGKLSDAIFYLTGYRLRRKTLADRQRD